MSTIFDNPSHTPNSDNSDSHGKAGTCIAGVSPSDLASALATYFTANPVTLLTLSSAAITNIVNGIAANPDDIAVIIGGIVNHPDAVPVTDAFGAPIYVALPA